jgi:hypothetical protein
VPPPTTPVAENVGVKTVGATYVPRAVLLIAIAALALISVLMIFPVRLSFEYAIAAPLAMLELSILPL